MSRWFGQAGERMGEEQDSKAIVGGIVSRVESRAQNIAGAGLVGNIGAGGGPNGPRGVTPEKQDGSQTTNPAGGTGAKPPGKTGPGTRRATGGTPPSDGGATR